MSKNRKKGLEQQLTHLQNAIKQSEQNFEELAKEHQETQEKIHDLETGESIEKFLKNEAYAFLLAEGLLDKFLDFRETFHRTKAQDALYNLVAEADLGGLWIDLK